MTNNNDYLNTAFDDYAVDMDTECVHQDFDDIDLYGTKLIEDPDDTFGDNIDFDNN